MTAIEDFSGRVAVVTGAASGIGRAIAEALVQQGATVVAADMDPRIEVAAAEIGAVARTLDVRDADAVQLLAEEVVATHGRVDILVNNAGVGPLAPVSDLTIADYRWVMDINYFGVVHGVKAFLPFLASNPEGGHIVNTASLAGLVAGPGMTAYSASKFAVVAFTEALAAELGMGGVPVGVSALVPAVVRSNIAENARRRPGNQDADGDGGVEHLPPGRVLEPEQVAQLVIEGIRSGRLYVITHPETLPVVAQRHLTVQQAIEDAAAADSVA